MVVAEDGFLQGQRLFQQPSGVLHLSLLAEDARLVLQQPGANARVRGRHAIQRGGSQVPPSIGVLDPDLPIADQINEICRRHRRRQIVTAGGRRENGLFEHALRVRRIQLALESAE